MKILNLRIDLEGGITPIPSPLVFATIYAYLQFGQGNLNSYFIVAYPLNSENKENNL